MLRFIKIDDLAKHVIANVEITESSLFSIGRVEAKKKTDELSCLFNYEKFGDGAAILRSFEDIHEDSDDFNSTSKAKTICNLISCMCFANILDPLHWRHEDVNEVLRLGFRLLCEVGKMKNLDDFQAFEEIRIAGVSFNVKLVNSDEGKFMEKQLDRRLTQLPEELLQSEKIGDVESRVSDGTKPRESQITQASYESSTLDVPLNEPRCLHDYLKKFKETFAVLDSNFMKLAIFKFHELLFVFDPKSSGIDGRLTKNRLYKVVRNILMKERESIGVKFDKEATDKEDHNEIFHGRLMEFSPVYPKKSFIRINSKISADETPIPADVPIKGGAYIAWFKSSEQLHDHIMKKIPSHFQHEHFTLKYFHVTKSIDADDNHLAPWCNFQAISSDHWILRANISQNDTQFCQLNRDNQDIPNCILAITFAQLCQMVEWNSTLIDIVLKLGDRLYRKSISKSFDSSSSTNLKLSLKEIDFPVFIRPFVIHVTDELVKKDFMVKSTDEISLQAMKKILGEFDGFGLLSAKNYSVAIWKENDAIFMFDPHEIGPNGIKNFNGSASVQKFVDHEKLTEIFFKNVKDLDGLNEFQLTRISILKTHFKENSEGGDQIPEDSNDLLNFSLYKQAGKFQMISANLKQPINFEYSQEICYAISAICISRALNPVCYTREIIDIILNLGNDLVEECGNLCMNEFDFNKQKKCQDEINWNFELDESHFNIQLDIFRRGVITIHPCPSPKFRRAFEEFFEHYSLGILITQSHCVAIWYEGSKFYTFYARNVGEDGKFSNERNSFPALLAFHSIDDLYENIYENLDKSIECQKYELRTCDLKIDHVDDECMKDPNAIAQEIFEETIPAISYEIAKEKINEKKVPVIEHREVIENAKKGGFIKTENYEVLLGKMSKYSKTLSHCNNVSLLLSFKLSVANFFCLRLVQSHYFQSQLVKPSKCNVGRQKLLIRSLLQEINFI